MTFSLRLRGASRTLPLSLNGNCVNNPKGDRMPLLKPGFFFLLILLFHLQIAAQPAKPSTKVREEQAMQERRAVQLLNELLQDTEKLEDNFLKSINVLYLKYRIADLLWDYDQPKARRLFIESFEAADKRIAAEMSSQLRSEIIDFLLPHDAVLAEELAASVINIIHKNNPENESSRMNGLSQQATLLLQVADAMDSPEQAARLIRSSFNGWISGRHITALQKLRRQSPALADELFLHAIAVVKRKPTHISNKIGILAPYLFAEMNEEKPPTPAQPPPGLIETFLNFVSDSFIPQSVAMQVNENDEFSTSSFDYLTMQHLIPYFEKYQPEKVRVFRERIEEIVAKVKQLGRKSAYDSERDAYIEAARQNVPDILATAEKETDREKRDDLYGNALFALMLQGKYEQAISLLAQIGNKLSSKVETTNTLYGMAAGFAYEQGKLEQSYEYAKHISDTDDRLRFIVEIAEKRLAQGDVLQAKRLLPEIKRGLKQVNDEWDKSRFSFDLANLETRINPAQGFQVMEEAIKMLNHLKRDDGNSHGSGPQGITLRMNRFDFSESFSLLAQEDFPRALALAKQIQEKERAAWAKLAVCRGVLRKTGSKASQ